MDLFNEDLSGTITIKPKLSRQIAATPSRVSTDYNEDISNRLLEIDRYKREQYLKNHLERYGN